MLTDKFESLTKLIESDFSVFLSKTAKNSQLYLRFFYLLFETIIKNQEKLMEIKFSKSIYENSDKLLQICLDFIQNSTKKETYQKFIIEIITVNFVFKFSNHTVIFKTFL